jgi:hypothetical protein
MIAGLSPDAIVDQLRNTVLRLLDDYGLLPSTGVSARTLRRIMRRGEKCRKEFILPVVGKTAWDQVGRRLNVSDSKLARILGFGEAMTEFLVAGVPMSAQARSLVIRIGALSRFILSIYDKLVDNVGEKELLPRSVLIQFIDDYRVSRRLRLPSDPSRKVIVRAVISYFSSLSLLPYASERSHARQTLGSAILALFDVETALRPDRRGATTLHEEDAKSKAALSFLSMGLPAWLATAHADSRRMSSHFKWLCEVGEFLGWIDDIVDMEEDYASGFANRIVVRLRTSKEPRSRVLESLADEVACLGRGIADEWSRNLRSPGAGRNSLDSFKTNVSLWLDGPRNLAV